MFEKDRAFVRQEVIRVMRDWGVVPSERGTGEGDVENWVDSIIREKGWEPYWEHERMPREFIANGHTKGGSSTPTPAPPAVPAGDPYMVKLDAIHADVQTILNGVRKFF